VYRRWRYFSRRDKQRLAKLDAAWRDPNVDALFYVGAGWGSARVLEDLAHAPDGLWVFPTAAPCCLLSMRSVLVNPSTAPWVVRVTGGCAARQGGCGLAWGPDRCSWLISRWPPISSADHDFQTCVGPCRS